MPFVKLDCAMLDSTVYLDRDVRDVFITALLMAVPRDLEQPLEALHVGDLELSGFVVPAGFYGMVEASGPGIVRRAGLDLTAGTKALEALCSPEIESRSRDHEGRRMARVDGGYIVLNYGKYRERDYTSAERSKRYRDKQRQDTALRRDVTADTRDGRDAKRLKRRDTRDITHAEAEAEAESRTTSSKDTPPPPDNSSLPETVVPATSQAASHRDDPFELEQPAQEQKPGTPRTAGHENRACRLPVEFELSAGRRAVAEREGVEAERTFAKFCDHWRAASGANARKRDWDAAWRNWCRTEADRMAGRRGGAAAGGGRLRTADEIEADERARAARGERVA